MYRHIGTSFIARRFPSQVPLTSPHLSFITNKHCLAPSPVNLLLTYFFSHLDSAHYCKQLSTCSMTTISFSLQGCKFLPVLRRTLTAMRATMIHTKSLIQASLNPDLIQTPNAPQGGCKSCPSLPYQPAPGHLSNTNCGDLVKGNIQSILGLIHRRHWVHELVFDFLFVAGPVLESPIVCGNYCSPLNDNRICGAKCMAIPEGGQNGKEAVPEC